MKFEKKWIFINIWKISEKESTSIIEAPRKFDTFYDSTEI